MYKKIITPPGAYHADELVAIATVSYCLQENLPVERREPTVEELEDPDVLVLDIGRDYNPEMGNFDHHHDRNLPATNMLILQYFVKNEAILKYVTPFYQYISDVDTGTAKKQMCDLPSLVRSMNGAQTWFVTARESVQTFVFSVLDEAKAKVKSEMVLDGLHSIVTEQGHFKVSVSSDLIPGWDEILNPHYNGLIQPNIRGGWQVVSRDSSVWTVPVSDSQTFRHNSGFMAVYPDYSQLLSHLNLK